MEKGRFTTYFTIGVFIALSAALGISLYFGKKQQDYSERLEQKIVMQDEAIAREQKALTLYRKDNDSMAVELFIAKERVYTLQQEVDKSRARVVASGDSTKKYITLYKKAQLDLDTVRMISDGGQAIKECEELWESVKIHLAQDDSANTAQMELTFQANKFIDTLQAQNKRLSSGYAECLVKSQQANLDLIAAKSKKKQTIWTRIRDWAIGAGAGYALRAATAK